MHKLGSGESKETCMILLGFFFHNMVLLPRLDTYLLSETHFAPLMMLYITLAIVMLYTSVYRFSLKGIGTK